MRKGLPPEIWQENIPEREQQGPRPQVRMSLPCSRNSGRTFIYLPEHSQLLSLGRRREPRLLGGSLSLC